MDSIYFCKIYFLSLFVVSSIIFGEAGNVGVNYGTQGDNLPAPSDVINLLKSRNINRIRIFDPNPDILTALRGSGIEVIVSIPDNLHRLGTDLSSASNWVNTNIVPYQNDVKFRYIGVGNEIPAEFMSNILPAMENINSALKSAGIEIPVTTAIATGVLATSYPPKDGKFSNEDIMRSIVAFLVANRSPLLVNVYPYFSYKDNLSEISLDYALFKATQVVVNDDGHEYMNLFDAITDAVYSALEKVDGANVDIVVTESGWPSAENGDIATIPNARTYNQNLISHVSGTNGTPKRPGKSIETYIFAIFNENLNVREATEKHFGLFYPDMTEVYPINFT